MFTDLLSTNEKYALMQVLATVAQVDGVLHNAERDVVTRYGMSLGLPLTGIEAHLNEAVTVDDLPLTDISGQARRIVFMEANTLAMIDGGISDEERDVVAALGARLGLTADEQSAITRHVQRGFDWTLEGMTLVQAGVST